MPRKGQKLASTLCAKPGCTESRHVYPGGGVSPYCKAHNGRRRMKQRDGQEPMSGRMMDILEYLLERKAQGELLAELRYPQAQAKSIRLLVHQQRIFRDERLEGVRYGITEAGEAALAPFAQYVNRRDGICPHCGVRPRHVRSSGHKDGWCLECQREQGREERALGIQYVDITRPCSRCGVKPLYQFPGGAYSSYCKDCTRIVRRENARKLRRERFLEYQATGKLPTCKKCKVKPVRAFPNCLSDYCADCYRTSHHRWVLNRVIKAVLPAKPSAPRRLKLHAPPVPDELVVAQRQKDALRLDYVPDEAVVKIMRAMQQNGGASISTQ